MAPAQCAAWDSYLDVTHRLLPALRDEQADLGALNAQLGAVAARILRYAPLWGEHGPMLVAALHSTTRHYWACDRGELADLLWVMADRLYLLSAIPRLPRRDDHDRRAP